MSNLLKKARGYLIELMLFFRFFQKIIGWRWLARWENNYILAEKELTLLPLILDNDSVVFDVGANRGELSYFFAITCGAKKVYSFEPQSRMFGVLTGVAGGIKNIEPVNIALSDSNGEKALQIPIVAQRQYTQAASLEEKHGNILKHEKVKIETLDSFIKRNKIDKLDFIKCDTEGHELAVLRGSMETLKCLRPLVYVEIKESNVKPIFELFNKLNYLPYIWDDTTSNLVTTRVEIKAKSENYYFLPAEKWSKVLNSKNHR